MRFQTIAIDIAFFVYLLTKDTDDTDGIVETLLPR